MIAHFKKKFNVFAGIFQKILDFFFIYWYNIVVKLCDQESRYNMISPERGIRGENAL